MSKAVVLSNVVELYKRKCFASRINIFSFPVPVRSNSIASTMSTYNALIARYPDGKGTLSLEKVSRPKLDSHQVLVKVQAAAQNPTDVKSFDGKAFPGTALGCDFAGTVEALGPDVTRLKVGDVIAALTRGVDFDGCGAYAEYSIADERIAFLIPRGTSPDDAATVPLAAATAWLGLFSSQHLSIDRSKGSRVQLLVWGGSSSVGLYTIQIAKIFEFEVAAVCSPRNFDLVKKAGAKHVFDYRSPTVVEDIKKVLPNLEYVYDTIGSKDSSPTASKAVREEGGALVTVRPDSAFTEDVEKRVKVTGVLVFTAFNRPLAHGALSWDVS